MRRLCEFFGCESRAALQEKLDAALSGRDVAIECACNLLVSLGKSIEREKAAEKKSKETEGWPAEVHLGRWALRLSEGEGFTLTGQGEMVWFTDSGVGLVLNKMLSAEQAKTMGYALVKLAAEAVAAENRRAGL